MTKKFDFVQNVILFLFFILGCSKDPIQRNPYLADIRFQRDLNLSLPLYNQLNFVGGSIFIPDMGIKGVIVFNLSGSIFLVW